MPNWMKGGEQFVRNEEDVEGHSLKNTKEDVEGHALRNDEEEGGEDSSTSGDRIRARARYAKARYTRVRNTEDDVEGHGSVPR